MCYAARDGGCDLNLGRHWSGLAEKLRTNTHTHTEKASTGNVQGKVKIHENRKKRRRRGGGALKTLKRKTENHLRQRALRCCSKLPARLVVSGKCIAYFEAPQRSSFQFGSAIGSYRSTEWLAIGADKLQMPQQTCNLQQTNCESTTTATTAAAAGLDIGSKLNSFSRHRCCCCCFFNFYTPFVVASSGNCRFSV